MTKFYFLATIFFCIVMLVLAINFYKPPTTNPKAGPILDWVCKSTVDNAKKPLEQQINNLQNDLKNLQNELKNLQNQNIWAIDNPNSISQQDAINYAKIQKNKGNISSNNWQYALDAWDNFTNKYSVIQFFQSLIQNINMSSSINIDETRDILKAAMFITLAYNKK